VGEGGGGFFRESHLLLALTAQAVPFQAPRSSSTCWVQPGSRLATGWTPSCDITRLAEGGQVADVLDSVPARGGVSQMKPVLDSKLGVSPRLPRNPLRINGTSSSRASRRFGLDAIQRRKPQSPGRSRRRRTHCGVMQVATHVSARCTGSWSARSDHPLPRHRSRLCRHALTRTS